MAGFINFMPATAPRSQITPGIPEIPDSKVATLSVSFIIYSFSRQKFPRLCTFPINTRCRISGNTFPRFPIIPEIPDNSRFKGCHTFSSLYHLLSQQTEIPRLCTFPINTRCRISGNTFPRFPIIPEIPDNSRFKGSFAFIDASLCKRDNKKEALQMKSFFFYFL